MFLFDKYAYFNPLKEQHPIEKILFSIGSLLLIITVKSNPINIILFFSMSVVLIGKAKISLSFYVKILLLPFVFLLLSIIAILLEFGSTVPSTAVTSFTWPFGMVFITPFGLERALHLFLTSLSATSCLYFLILTTPFDEIILIGKKCRIPVILLELFAYVYRFIFLVFHIASQIHLAQEIRLGHQTWRLRFRSLALLLGGLLTQTLQSTTAFHHVSLIKNDDGMFRSLSLRHHFSPVFWVSFSGYALCLLTIAVISK